MKAKKILSMLLAVLLVAAMLPMGIVSAGAANTGMTGSGSQSDPYKIWDAEGWAALVIETSVATFEGKYVELASNIDLSGLTADVFQSVHESLIASATGDRATALGKWGVDSGWEFANHKNWAVGSVASIGGFKGSFDGKNYKISNLHINPNGSNGNGAGLFGRVGAGAYVGNFTLENCSFGQQQAQNRVILMADIVGKTTTVTVENIDIKNCSVGVTTSILRPGGCTGVIGTVYGGNISIKDILVENCDLSNQQDNVGFIGRVSNDGDILSDFEIDNVDIRNTTFRVTHTSSEYSRPIKLGGIIAGHGESVTAFAAEIKNCDVQATFEVPFAPVASTYGIGGIIAVSTVKEEKTIVIQDCTADISVFYASTNNPENDMGIGGIVGIANGASMGTTINNCKANVYLELANSFAAYGVLSAPGINVGGILAKNNAGATINPNCKSDLYVVDAGDGAIASTITKAEGGYINVNGESEGTPECDIVSVNYSTMIEAGMGAGTEANPFVLDSMDDWTLFAKIARSYSFVDSYYAPNEDATANIPVSFDKHFTVNELTTTDVMTFLQSYEETYGEAYQPAATGSTMSLELEENIVINLFTKLDTVFANLLAATGNHGWGVKFDGADAVKADEFNKTSVEIALADANVDVEASLVLYVTDTQALEFGTSFEINAREYMDKLSKVSANTDKALGTALASYSDALAAYYATTPAAVVTEAGTATGTSTNVTFTGISVDLSEEGTLKLHFTLAAGVDTATLEVTGGTIDANGVVTVDGIVAKDLGTDVTVVVDGVTVVASVADWADANLENATVEIATFATAVSSYSSIVATYFATTAA